MNKVGNHLNTTVNAYKNAGKEFIKIDKDVIKITDGEVSISPKLPEVEQAKTFDEAEPGIKVHIKGVKKDEQTTIEA